MTEREADITQASEPHRPRALGSLLFTAIFGFALGCAVMLAVFYFQGRRLPASASGAPPPPPVADRLMFEASQDRLTYRAHAAGLEPGSSLYDAIMAGQPVFASEVAEMASFFPDQDIWVEVLFEQTASAGPLTSLLRTDYIQRGGEDPDIRYAATLVSTDTPGGFSARDIFRADSASEIALDTMLCEQLREELYTRTGQTRIGEAPVECAVGSPLSFFDGPPMVLLPSDTPEKIGAVAFFIEQGRVAPANAGVFVITIPQSDLTEFIRPAYLENFGGTAPALN